MGDPQFKEGDWVKDKNGTQGMTVVSYVKDTGNTEYTGEVRCRYKNSVGEEVESNFWEADLVKLNS